MDAKADTQSATVTAARHYRAEDDVLVRGQGRYIADAPEPNQAYAYFVRSPHAFARIVGIDTVAAAKAPGVIAVLTDKDMEGVGNISRHPPLPGRDGAKLAVAHRPALARDRVMHVGEGVAMVIAERAMTAQDAAELVNVEYEPLTPVTDARAALKPGAPQLWPEAPGNLAVDWPGPAADPDANAAEVERIFASAKYVARVSEMNQRLCVASMEPRGATASYDAARDAYTLRTCSQSAGTMCENVLAIMNWPKEKLRVITEDVGGAFGLKTSAYPEYIALLVAAKKIGRPVHWMSGRSEAFLSDNQARDIYSDVELALDEKGKFLALRIRSVGNMGAYLGAIGANIPTLSFTRCLPGMYDIKPIDIGVKCIYTNTLPTAPYRGAGRPESSYALERVVDEAARVLRTHKIGALPVVEKGTLVGILAGSDVLDAFVDLSGVAEPTYHLTLTGDGPEMERRIRQVIERERGELKWLHRDRRQRPAQVHLRLKAQRIDDIVTELEAGGFEVQAVVAPPPKRRR